MSDALLQRAGVSADKFIYIINPDEQDWMILQEKIIRTVYEGNREPVLLLLEEYNKLTQKKCRLHRQFSYLCEVVIDWKNGMHTAHMLDRLEQAWRITMGDIPMEEMAGCRFSLTECNIKMLYCRIQEDRGDGERAAEGYRQLLEYLETKVDEEDKTKLFSQAAYRLTVYYLERQEPQRAAAVAEKAVSVLKACGRLFYIRKFLKILLQYGNPPEGDRAVFREVCHSLEWLYDACQIEEEEHMCNICFGVSEVELCGDLIRARRKAMGMSQEKLAEGICDTVTISRIERGKVTPKTQILQKIMERIEMKEGCFEAAAQIERPELFGLADKIAVLLSLFNGKEAEPLIEELEIRSRKADGTDKFAGQYIENVKALALLMQGKITAGEHYDRQWAAFHMTAPYFERKRQKEWRFSRQEVNIANALSYSCEEAGKAEEVLGLLYDIKNQYEHKPFGLLHYIAGYVPTIRNIGKLLGNMGEHEKAVEIAKQGILMGLQTGRGTVLGLLLYDCGMNMERLWKAGLGAEEEGFHYIKASAALNLFFYGKEKSMIFVEHLKNQYQYEIGGLN